MSKPYEDYEVVAYLDNREPPYIGMSTKAHRIEVTEWERLFESFLGPHWRDVSTRCHHCGNRNLRWIAVAMQKDTGERIVLGPECVKNLGVADGFVHFLQIVKWKSKMLDAQERAYRRYIRYLSATTQH